MAKNIKNNKDNTLCSSVCEKENEALKKSEEKYATLVEKGNDGVLIIQGAGILKYVNSIICGMMGYSKEEALGKSFLDYVSPEYKKLVAERYEKRLKGEDAPNKYEIEILSKDGKRTPVEVNASQIKYEDKPAVMAIVRDITERKRAEKILKERADDLENTKTAMINLLEDIEKERDLATREKNKMNAILYGIGDGVFALDANYKITMFNNSASIITGFSEKEVLGEKYDKFLKFIDEKTGEVVGDFLKDAFATGKIGKMKNSTMVINKAGRVIPVADSVAPIFNEQGKVSGCVVVFHDATQEREINKAKTEFISLASHQLRTPLTGIQWVVERFLKKEKLSELGKNYLGDIHVSVRRLNELVDLLLNVSRIEEGRVSVSPREFDLVDFLEEYLKECEPLVVKKNIKMTFVEHLKELKIFTDSSVLRNIVQSIVSNAIEYTSQNGKIEISLLKDADKNFFRLEVRDNGIGIPEAEQKEIFSKFKRASNAKLIKTDGTGLGLYLARQAVNLLGGKMWFSSPAGGLGALDGESSKNPGTIFFVEMPMETKVEKVDK